MLAPPLVTTLALALVPHALDRSYFVDVAAAPAAPSIVVGSNERWVAWLDARDGSLRGRIDVDGSVWAVAIDPAGTLAGVLLRGGRVVLWPLVEGGDLISVDALAPPKDPDDGEAGWRFGAYFEFAPDGERLLVASAGRGIVLLSRSGERTCTIAVNEGSWFGPALAWAPGGARFAYTSEKTIHLVDARSGEPARFVDEGESAGEIARIDAPFLVHGLDFAPNGARLASAHEDGRIRVWDLAGGKEVARFEHVDPMWGPPPAEPVDDGFDMTPYVGQVAYSPDGSRLAYTTGTGVHLGVFDLASGERIGIGPFSGGRMGEPSELRWTADGNRVWYAFVSGVMDVQWMQFGPGRRYGSLQARGTAPVFGEGGRGFTCLSDGTLRALDGTSIETLWEVAIASFAKPTAPPREGR